jgi:hypothetical protein
MFPEVTQLSRTLSGNNEGGVRLWIMILIDHFYMS